MKERSAQFSNFRPGAARVDLKIVPPHAQTDSPSTSHSPHVPRRAGSKASGIEVREEELGLVKAQCMYKMRCECGRSWFELELPKLIQCPACAKRCLVSL